jgi:hypothetical protein
MKDKKKQKYWLCEFFERCGDNEHFHRYIYSDKNLKDMGYEDEKDDYKILSQFFLHKITPEDFYEWKQTYWLGGEKLVSFYNWDKVNPSEFKTLQKAGVYVNGDKLMFDWDKGEAI